MITLRTIQVVIREKVVAEFTYKPPIDATTKGSLEFFTTMWMLLYPDAVIQCINTKDGVGEKFTCGSGGDSDLFSE